MRTVFVQVLPPAEKEIRWMKQRLIDLAKAEGRDSSDVNVNNVIRLALSELHKRLGGNEKNDPGQHLVIS